MPKVTYIETRLTTEWCQNCDTEHDIPVTVKPVPKCPSCKKPLVPCSACDIPNREGKNGLCTGCKNGSKFELHPAYNI